jgi:hypothetical protein
MFPHLREHEKQFLEHVPLSTSEVSPGLGSRGFSYQDHDGKANF